MAVKQIPLNKTCFSASHILNIIFFSDRKKMHRICLSAAPIRSGESMLFDVRLTVVRCNYTAKFRRLWPVMSVQRLGNLYCMYKSSNRPFLRYIWLILLNNVKLNKLNIHFWLTNKISCSIFIRQKPILIGWRLLTTFNIGVRRELNSIAHEGTLDILQYNNAW